MGGTAALHDAARGPIRPLGEKRRMAWSTLLWHWTPRLSAPVVLDVARRVGQARPELDDESLRLAIRDELIRYARTRPKRSEPVRRSAAAARAARKANLCPQCGADSPDGRCPPCGI